MTKNKAWFFDVTFTDGTTAHDVKVEASNEDDAYEALLRSDAYPVKEIASTHLQHTRNGKVRRS